MRVRRANDAFSLVEVMIAILVLGVGLVGLTQGLTTALHGSKDAEVQTVAALLAAGQVETLRAEGLILPGTREGKGGDGLTDYKWREIVRKANIDGLYDVQVVVESVTTGKELYDLRTLLFDPPIESTAEKASRSKKQKSGASRKRRGGGE